MFLWYLKYNKEKLSTDNLKLKKLLDAPSKTFWFEVESWIVQSF